MLARYARTPQHYTLVTLCIISLRFLHSIPVGILLCAHMLANAPVHAAPHVLTAPRSKLTRLARALIYAAPRLHLRSRSEDADMCNQLRVLGFEVGVVQLSSVSYVVCHPVPLTNGQHLVKRLRSPHPMCALFELGVVSCMYVGQ